jgi:hypothetical protein
MQTEAETMKNIDEFKYLYEKEDYIRHVRDAIGVCDSIKTLDPEVYEWFADLFTRHPGYPPKVEGMVDLMTKFNVRYKNNLEFHMQWYDGSLRDISPFKCVRKNRKSSRYSEAMRSAVEFQIQEFRTLSAKTCAKCGTCSPPEGGDFEVDHHHPQFIQLVSEFLKSVGVSAPLEFDALESNVHCFKEEDREYAEAWSSYHSKNANLRLLCWRCNRTRSKVVKLGSKEISSKKLNTNVGTTN